MAFFSSTGRKGPIRTPIVKLRVPEVATTIFPFGFVKLMLIEGRSRSICTGLGYLFISIKLRRRERDLNPRDPYGSQAIQKSDSRLAPSQARRPRQYAFK